MRRADPAGSRAWIQPAVQGGIPLPAFACGNKERCSRGVLGTRRRQAAMARPEGMADGMLTPASLKTQRRPDQMKEGSAPLCVFASLREPIRVLRALRGPKNLTSLNHESHRTRESFHRRCHQREPWQTQAARESARPVRRTRSGLPSRLRVFACRPFQSRLLLHEKNRPSTERVFCSHELAVCSAPTVFNACAG
jgi:hypothetical protein